MYFVNVTKSSPSSDADVQIVDRPNAYAAPTPTKPTIAQSDVPGLPLRRLRSDRRLWAAYERGWKDAYAAALAASAAVHPPSLCATTPPLPPSTWSQTPPPQSPPPKSPPPQSPPPQSPPLQSPQTPSSPTDPRPASVGPVRRRTRADRQIERRKVPTRPVQRSSVMSSNTSTTAEILPYNEEETSMEKCDDWVNSIELNEQCVPEDVICPWSDVVSCSTIPQTPEEIADAMWQPLQDPCFQNCTTAETAAYKSAWFHIPSADCCEHCVLKTY